jgi:hypothetical protein
MSKKGQNQFRKRRRSVLLFSSKRWSGPDIPDFRLGERATNNVWSQMESVRQLIRQFFFPYQFLPPVAFSKSLSVDSSSGAKSSIAPRDMFFSSCAR